MSCVSDKEQRAISKGERQNERLFSGDEDVVVPMSSEESENEEKWRYYYFLWCVLVLFSI